MVFMTKRQEATEVMLGATNIVTIMRGLALAREWERESSSGASYRPILHLLADVGFAPDFTMDVLARSMFFWDVVQGVEVFRLQGCALTDAQILDRAANMTAGLTGNYKITPL
jgi:hypothetical protein